VDELRIKKRINNIDTWAKNIRKKLKAQCKEYCNIKGKNVSAKLMKVHVNANTNVIKK